MYDKSKEFYNNPDMRELLAQRVEDAKITLGMLQYLIGEFGKSPTDSKSDLIYELFTTLKDQLGNIDIEGDENTSKVIPDDYEKGKAIYKSSSGSVGALKSTYKASRKPVEDDVQDLLCLHRTTVWNATPDVLEAVDDPSIIGLSPEQFRILRKVKLLDPLTNIEERLVQHPRLFEATPAELRASLRPISKGKEWQSMVNTARALNVGLSMRAE